MSKQKHNSHHIFVLLGLLIFVFLLIFGIRYFQSEYSFGQSREVQNSQNIDSGFSINNPFLEPLEEDIEIPDTPLTDPNIDNYLPPAE